MQAITINNNHLNEYICFLPLPYTVVNFPDHYLESLLTTCYCAAKCGWTNQWCWQAVSRQSLNHFKHGLLLELKLPWQAEVLGRESQNESHLWSRHLAFFSFTFMGRFMHRFSFSLYTGTFTFTFNAKQHLSVASLSNVFLQKNKQRHHTV